MSKAINWYMNQETYMQITAACAKYYCDFAKLSKLVLNK